MRNIKTIILLTLCFGILDRCNKQQHEEEKAKMKAYKNRYNDIEVKAYDWKRKRVVTAQDLEEYYYDGSLHTLVPKTTEPREAFDPSYIEMNTPKTTTDSIIKAIENTVYHR